MENKRRLTYIKRCGERVPESCERKKSPVEHLRSESLSTPSLPLHYVKSDGVLSYSLVCVISGGTDRERDLLTELERKQSFQRLNVVFVSTKTAGYTQGGMTPLMMQRAYDTICQEGIIHLIGRDVQLESVDRIYMFTDVDHYYDELLELMARRKDESSPEWIISNPDIEIWIYYCFRNDPETDLASLALARESERSSLLKRINGTFNNGGGLDPRKTFEHLPEGIAHAREHYMEDAHGIPTLLSTQMFRFSEDVLQSLGEEYLQWLQQRSCVGWVNKKRK